MTNKEWIAWIVLLTLLYLCWWFLPHPDPIYRQSWGASEKAAANKLMRHHGIDGYYCDPSGCWFERKGRRVNL